jgi:hypothetical protein
MKHFLIVFMALSLGSIYANETVIMGPKYPIIETSRITVSLFNFEQRQFFNNAQFDYENDNLEFEAFEKIKYIQIFEENGKLKFQIPVMSKSVFISRKLFKSGTYKLGFMIEGQDQVEFTTVEVLR